ncbi:Carotenoid 9 10(9 10)-cleavage dioxygenase [Fusarium mundagurra]|uniref:Carotenoid 9 10(9 10)-cleavage dioxygenase n=1 Tax=Fusarium mundagurra TaxID=1567541 RepID=A0A8H5Z3N5_9HYPO|nr:Carotenoid 9 10(9 10)-cleavage dioxygenase [Fusarium mundagurra]
MKFLQQNSLTQTSMSQPDQNTSSPLRHPYLTGNFAPIHQTTNLTPCTYSGCIPPELTGGQCVRNGGNPVSHQDLGNDAHWFDGDGMLSGVAFRKTSTDGKIVPEFVNQYILTDLYLSRKTTAVVSPIMPSITTLVNPLSTMLKIMFATFRTIFLVILSNLPGSQQAIKRISVANTAVLYHDGRALATCESGPPMRIQLPSLDTVGWYDGVKAEGELEISQASSRGSPFGGSGLFSFMKEWTTGHPKVDPVTGEMLLYHNTFMPPYVHYSVLPKSNEKTSGNKLVNQSVLGVSGARMMHDFGASRSHTIIMDLPLSLDPLNTIKAGNIRPPVRPKSTRARDWSVEKKETACRYKEAPTLESPWEANGLTDYFPTAESDDYDQCRLYYYEFDMSTTSRNKVKNQWALSAIPFEFPSVRPDREMQQARYIYGCSTSTSCFGVALGRADKVDLLVKMDAKTLIQRGKKMNTTPVTGCIDRRSVSEVLEEQEKDDPIKIFRLPSNHYAQEPRFVPRASSTEEDDGYLLFYVFDESQLLPSGDCPISAISELWILDAKNMREVVAKVRLPQRVPYGLHGTWFSGKDIEGQRAVESLRSLEELQRKKEDWVDGGGQIRRSWMVLRERLERAVG